MDEFEKLGGYGLLGKILSGVMRKSKFVNTAVKSMGTFADTYATNPLSKNMVKTTGGVFNKGMDALKASQQGKSTIRPWLGTTRSPLGVQEVVKNNTKFLENPLKAVKERAYRGTAHMIDNFRVVAQEGAGSFIKKEISRAGQFSKEVTGLNGKKYNIIGRRSLAGQALNTLTDTGIGFGALALATNKNDDSGKPRTALQRIANAGKEAFMWGVAKPLAIGKALVYDLPKMTMDLNKGF